MSCAIEQPQNTEGTLAIKLELSEGRNEIYYHICGCNNTPVSKIVKL